MALGINYIPGSAGVAYYGDVGEGGILPCAFGAPNSPYDIGVAFFVGINGAGAGIPFDDNGNTWTAEEPYDDGITVIQWYTCPVLKGSSGPVTVSLPGCTADSYGGPVFGVLGYSRNPVGIVGIHAFQPIGDCGIFCGPQLNPSMNFNASGGSFYSTLICLMYDDEGPSGTARTWSVTVPGGTPDLSIGVRQQYKFPGSNSCGAIADIVMPFVTSLNLLEWGYAPSSPVIGQGPQLHVVCLSITSQS